MALIGELTIDLNVLANNWQILADRASTSCGALNDRRGECAAVVKADAYGLGVNAVAPALYKKGCRTFFVANLHEAIDLAAVLPGDRIIYTLQGFASGEQKRFAENNIRPVIVSRQMLEQWVSFEHPQKPFCGLKVNTGMNRLGLDVAEFEAFIVNAEQVHSSKVELILSHLACADEVEHPKNKEQLECFKELIRFCGRHAQSFQFRFSLANSGGICLGSEYIFDLVRPGVALYSGTLGSSGLESIGLRNPVSLYLPIIQVRSVAMSETIGYGASHVFSRDSVIAIVSGGYADGLFRYLSNKGYCYYQGKKVAIAGRVSMDSFAVDLTDVDRSDIDMDGGNSNNMVCAFDSVGSLLDLASCSGTITYELLTSLSDRYTRKYI